MILVGFLGAFGGPKAVFMLRKVPEEGLVAFRVDGERFEILEQTIRARGDTLLATLLDDPQNDARTVLDLGIQWNSSVS